MLPARARRFYAGRAWFSCTSAVGCAERPACRVRDARPAAGGRRAPGRARCWWCAARPGIGKTALLDYAAERADGLPGRRAPPASSRRWSCAFAGLHQLCAPLLGPPRAAARRRSATRSRPRSACSAGDAAGPLPRRPGRAEPARPRPPRSGRWSCLVDDAQWLDRASAQALAFVARRLLAESVALVFAVREPREPDELAGLPELRGRRARRRRRARAAGLGDQRAAGRARRATGSSPRRAATRWRCSSCRAGSRRAELAGGFGLPRHAAAAGPDRGELPRSGSSRCRPRRQRLLLLAAAEPVGDPALLWRAAEQLGIGAEAAGARRTRPGCSSSARGCAFRHPLVRSAVYRRRVGRRTGSGCTARWPRRPTRASIPIAAPGTARRPPSGPTRTSPPSSSARPAGRRPAAAWPRRPRSSSARPTLTPDPARRAGARAGRGAGQARRRRARRGARAAGDRARPGRSTSWSAPARSCCAPRSRSPPARQRRAAAAARGGQAARAARRRAGPRDLPGSARRGDLRGPARRRAAALVEVARGRARRAAARYAPRAVDLLLDGLATRFTEGYAAGAPPLRRALGAFRARRLPARGRAALALARVPHRARTCGTTRPGTRSPAASVRARPRGRRARRASARASPRRASALHRRRARRRGRAGRGGRGDHRGDRQPPLARTRRSCSPPGAATRPRRLQLIEARSQRGDATRGEGMG